MSRIQLQGHTNLVIHGIGARLAHVAEFTTYETGKRRAGWEEALTYCGKKVKLWPLSRAELLDQHNFYILFR